MKYIFIAAFLEVYDAYLDAPSTLPAKNKSCGEMQMDWGPKSGQAGPFQYQLAYSGHTWSRLQRGAPSTTKQMPMPTTWEADTKELKAKAKTNE